MSVGAARHVRSGFCVPGRARDANQWLLRHRTGSMKPTSRLFLLAATALLATAAGLNAQRDGRRSDSIGVRTEPDAAGISWFGTWDGALAEARRTHRPILLMSATPTCSTVPGVW